MRALSLAMLGYLDQALVESDKALELSERLGHKPSIYHTHMFRSELSIILNRVEEAEAHLNTSISLAKKYSLAAYLNAADLMHGLVRALRGEVEVGISQAEAALVTLMSVPSRRFHFTNTNSDRRTSQDGSGDIDGALALFDTCVYREPYPGLSSDRIG
jgi:tetratricopeptide (TPR) repeat protein